MKTVVAYIIVLAIAVAAIFLSSRAIEAVGVPMYAQLDAPYLNDDGERISSVATGPKYSTILFGISVGILGLLFLQLTSKRTYLIELLLASAGILLCWLFLAGYGWILDSVFGFQDGYNQIFARLLWFAGIGVWAYFVFRCMRPIALTLEMHAAKSRKRSPPPNTWNEDE